MEENKEIYEEVAPGADPVGGPPARSLWNKILTALMWVVRGVAYPAAYTVIQALSLMIVSMASAAYQFAVNGIDASVDPDLAMKALYNAALKNTEIRHAAIIIAAVMTVLLILIIQFMMRRPVKEELHLKAISPAVAALAVGTGVTLNFVISYIIMLIPEDVLKFIGKANNDEPEYVGSMLIYVLAAVIMAPIIEELVFRNFLYERSRRAMPVWLAILFVSAFFGAVHGSVLQGVYAASLGVLLAVLLERSRSILPGILCHFGFNSVSIIAAAYGQNIFSPGTEEMIDVFYTVMTVISFIIFIPLTILLVRSAGANKDASGVGA